jgi:hypothetical protein
MMCPTSGHELSRRALSALLTGIKPDDHLQAVALDGFAAELALRRCSIPKAHGPGWRSKTRRSRGRRCPKASSAGPFYLVWTDPQAGNISPEQWPSEVASIKRMAPVAERFPALLPDPALKADDPVNQGFALFQKNCLACHRLNGAGMRSSGRT